MPPTTPTTEPSRITAGDSLAWERPDLAREWDPAVYTLRYILQGPATRTWDATGASFAVTVGASETTALPAGTYTLFGYAVNTGADTRQRVSRTRVVVSADPATVTPRLHHAEEALAKIEAVILGRITADVEEYELEGQRVAKLPLPELERLRTRYRVEVANLRNGGRFRIRGMGVRF